MELLNKLNNFTLKISSYFPEEKSLLKIFTSLFSLLIAFLLIFDFILPRANDYIYVYDQEYVGETSLLLRTERSADFIIDVKEGNYYQTNFIGSEFFIFKTLLFGRIDPIIMYSEDVQYNVIYNLRTTYFITPILTILFSLCLLYNKYDDEDGVFDAVLFSCLIITHIFSFLFMVNTMFMYRGEEQF